jgi:hypothetical protein
MTTLYGAVKSGFRSLERIKLNGAVPAENRKREVL